MQQGARAAAANRMRTHFGGPTQTFAGLEAALAAALATLERTAQLGNAAPVPTAADAAGGGGGGGGDSAAGGAPSADASSEQDGDARPQLSQRGEVPAAEAPGSGCADAGGVAPAAKLKVLNRGLQTSEAGGQRRAPAALAPSKMLPGARQLQARAGVSARTASPHDGGGAGAGTGGGGRSGGSGRIDAQAQEAAAAAVAAPLAETLPAVRCRVALLLEFLAALERFLHAAFEGSLDRRPPPATATAFFVQNRKVRP